MLTIYQDVENSPSEHYSERSASSRKANAIDLVGMIGKSDNLAAEENENVLDSSSTTVPHCFGEGLTSV